MVIPSCQLGTSNSPRKTPQTTPSKIMAAGDGDVAAVVPPSPAKLETGETKASNLSLEAARVKASLKKAMPTKENFGCLRLFRLSSLLLSSHC